MWRVTVKGLLAHKLRMALTALAIILGVTFVSGTLVLTDTLHNTFTSLFNRIYQNIDFEVRGTAAFDTANGGYAVRKPIPESILAAVRAIPGVATAEGGVGGYAQFIAPDGKPVTTGGAPTIGMSLSDNPKFSSLRIIEGKVPTTPTQVVIDEGTARKYHFIVGNQVRILLPTAPQTFTISGIVQFGNADNLAGATIAAFYLPTAQQLFNEVGKFDTIDVITTKGADKAAVKEAIAKVLGTGVEVVTGQTVSDEQSSAINKGLGFFSTALLVFAAIALFVGGFTIFNTFSIIVGQRTRELAMLRIVGASRRQVFRSVLLEALIMGIVASLIGLGLGVLTAMGLEQLLKAFGITLPAGALIFKSSTVIAALVVGVGVTLFSAISPARRAVTIPPIAAISTHQSVSRESSRRRITFGVAMGILGVAVLALGLSKPKIQLVGLGAIIIFIGVGMLAPIVARPISSVLGQPLARMLGISGRLGRENSMRSPRRTAQTSAALMVGLALVSTMAVFGASISKSTTSSVNNAISPDYLITAASNGGPVGGISFGARNAVAAVPGVTHVSTVFNGQFQINGALANLASIEPSDLGTTIILQTAKGALSQSLTNGDLLVDSNKANSDHLSVGSVVNVNFAETGRSTIKVGGIYKPNALLGSYAVGTTYFRAHFAAYSLPFAILLSTSGGATPAATASVKVGLKDYPNLTVQTRAEFEKTQAAQVNKLLGLVYALLALAILIAMIGIVNTLMLSIFERTHEIGLLRAVGMRRRQIKAMIRSEAVILSVFGAIIGVIVGTGLGVALADSLKLQGITDIVIPYSNLAIFLVIAAILGLAAATWPARRASRLNVLEAIYTD